MDKKRKDIISIILIAAVLLCACGTGGKNASQETPVNAQLTENDALTGDDQQTADEVSLPEKISPEEELLSLGESVIPGDFTADLSSIETGRISAGAVVHDPSIFKVDDTYYLYGSHMASAKSDNLTHWNMMSTDYSKNNPVFGQMYESADEAFAYAGSKNSLISTDDGKDHVWAPHVIYNEVMGKYCMYYCTSSTWNVSNLCLAIADTPEGPFIWQTPLLYSGFTNKTIENTDVLDYMDIDRAKHTYLLAGEFDSRSWPNCIDPTVFSDTNGKMWMVYGSWSGGIFLLEIDPETGLIIHPEENKEEEIDSYFGKRLIGGGNQSIEGAYVLYDRESAYYYLYVSYGSLVNQGGYQIRVFRSQAPDGPYVDMNGTSPHKLTFHNLHGLKLSGNYRLPSLERAYMATGHNSAFIDDDGKKYIVYHTRFEGQGEKHSPRVHQVVLNKDGWPCMLPFQTSGEKVQTSGYDMEQIVGRYFVINQGMDISEKIAEPVILYLMEDGTVVGLESSAVILTSDEIEFAENIGGESSGSEHHENHENNHNERGESCETDRRKAYITLDGSVIGTWTCEAGTCYLEVSINKITYRGVFCDMSNEAGRDVMTFSCVGDNKSLWGVRAD